jgi:hypothetical protein
MATGGMSGRLGLSQEDLGEILREARAGTEAEVAAPETAALTVENAVEIARELGLEEEQVRKAAGTVYRRRLRPERRAAIRARRRTAFLGSAVVAALGIGAAALAIPGALPGLLAILAVPAVLAWRWLAAPISDQEADALELPPVPGLCRVCGLPAQAPNSTFCGVHRYRGPGGA